MTDDRALNPGQSPTDPISDDTTRTAAPSGEPGSSIGSYHLLQKIGEGGMGEVWLAEQTEPIRRRVALKLIKAGLDTKQVVARFEAERQALALMDHPAIATVFDAGLTPRGLPYFAMEYVRGEPITAYCDRHRLTNRERIELFTLVCEGVQHAHQKGIIHRDLKPSNVLVTIQNEKPVPKIIDFGVAKATAQPLTERTMFTELGVLIGTPAYMSPEQAEMTGLDIDTRTDIYALGVMLYQLLVGALPFDPAELRKVGFDEIRRRIREVDPPRPSTRISSMGQACSESAKNRRTEPARLVGQLKGDLDWITMKALEKDRTRRYGSPSELAADLERHLRHEPVLAGPPSTMYRARKFVRRHRFGVAVAAVAAVALVAFAFTMAAQARRIARERDRAERVSEFLVELFKVSDPSEARGNQITAREILDRGAARIEKELGDEPQVQAQLMNTMGNVYTSLGLYQKAEPIVGRALEVRRGALGNDHPDTLASMSALAFLYERQGRYRDSEKVCLPLVEARRRVLGENHPDTLHSMNRLAVVYERERRLADSGKLYREVYERRRRVLGEDHPDTLWSKNNVASACQDEGRFAEAERIYRETLEARRRVSGPDHPDTLWVMDNLARAYAEGGSTNEAEKLWTETLQIKRRVLGEEHPETLRTMGSLASARMKQGRPEEALKLIQETVDISQRVLGESHPNTLAAMTSLAMMQTQAGLHDDAERGIEKVIEIERRVFGESNPETLTSLSRLADIYAGQGKAQEADRTLGDLLAIWRRGPGTEDPDALGIINNSVATSYVENGRYAEAEAVYREALEIERRTLGENCPGAFDSQFGLAEIYTDQGNLEAADRIYTRLLEAWHGGAGAEDQSTLHIINNIAFLVGKQGRYAEAEKIFREVLETTRRVLGEDHTDTITGMHNLAVTLGKQGEHAESDSLFKETIEKERRVLGENDPMTAYTTYKLGCALASRGDRANAIETLRLAVRRGYHDADRMAQEPDLVSLHGDPEFEKLLSAVRKSAPKS